MFLGLLDPDPDKLVFFCILKVNDETEGSGSTLKCHGSATLIKRIFRAGAVDPLAASGLRKRTAGSQGRIRLTLIYESRVQELKIFVHEAAGLPGQH
jgi:hypothetical protein